MDFPGEHIMIVFVTGASAGFGAAIARRFAKDGHRVVVTGRRRERLEDLVAELGRDKILPLVFDVRDRHAVEHAFEALPASFAEIDVLVNNAGLALGLEPAQKANLDDWDAMVDTNVKGLTYVTRAALPSMVARDRGLIVNLGSTAARYPYPGGNVYGATKAVGGSEFSTIRFHGNADRAAKLYEGADALTPEDIAEAVYWVATLPARVNINAIEMMPVTQAFGPLAVHRG
jgi:3-hydroxy acid dehydrogenase/malonic semialdehyde reductase